MLQQIQFRAFASIKKNDDDVPPEKKPRTRAAKKTIDLETVEAVEIAKPKRVRKSKTEGKERSEKQPQQPTKKMYVLKFNSPILPYAKFPLTQNKYIQEFLKMYEADQHKVDQVIGVHFPQNNNSLAKDTVGIEVFITKKNNLTMIESASSARYRVDSYDQSTNFCEAALFEDLPLTETFGTEVGKDKTSQVTLNQKDLLSSELFELKNLWFTYNKRINQLLMILPQEVLNRYDMVVKSLQPPVFDSEKYSPETEYLEIFNEVVFKMGQFYFAVFQAIFSKDNESMRPMLTSFL